SVGLFYCLRRRAVRLGCINHARLTAAAIAADGLQCIGWIANEIDPQMERIEENIGMLRQRLAMPCWGRIPWRPGADAAAQAHGLQVPR
uniref:ATP-dependent dethiobiotin synthetase BioD n=1 Tax=Xanthomonas phaseoli TaxID=1985254 RepID=UPI003CCF3012